MLSSHQHAISEPFDTSPFLPGGTGAFEDDFNQINNNQDGEADASIPLPMKEKENNARENNVAKIKVVVC